MNHYREAPLSVSGFIWADKARIQPEFACWQVLRFTTCNFTRLQFYKTSKSYWHAGKC